jgi:uncharacterized membrane-anchored protein
MGLTEVGGPENAFAYWAAVMMVAVFGTMAADTVHHQLGVAFGMSTSFFPLAVAATFWMWHRRENTVDGHSITTQRIDGDTLAVTVVAANTPAPGARVRGRLCVLVVAAFQASRLC